MINNLNTKEEIQNILNNEKKQIIQFKNELSKLLKAISKRESLIENIKKLDNIFIKNNELTKINKIVNEKNKSSPTLNMDDEIIYNYKQLEEKNKIQIENDINNCLKLLRINSVNAVHQFNKFRLINNYIITSNKIDIDKLKNNYGYKEDYLIKMKNDLDFLTFSNINLIYNFKINDPFLLSLIPQNNDKNDKFKKIPASEELISTINNYLFILAQEELLFKMKFKNEIKLNIGGKEQKNNNANNNKGKKNLQKEYNNLLFLNNKNKEINKNNNNKIKKIHNLYFNNITKNQNNNEDNVIPMTSAAKLQQKFDFYDKLKNDLFNDKNEISNKNKEQTIISKNTENKILYENKDNKDNKEIIEKKDNNDDKDNKEKNNDNINENKFNCIWFKDNFNKFRNLYNEYYNKLSQKTIDLFSINKNADNIINGISPKIAIYQKDNNKIYGICGINYYYDIIDNNKLILKINHLSSLEKDEDESQNNFPQKEKKEYKIYDNFIELIKTLPYQIIELNLNIYDNNDELLKYFINKHKFEIKDEKENNKNENGDNEANNKDGEIKSNENDKQNKKIINTTLRLYNNNFDINDENIKKLKESNEIKYNNTSILSLIEDGNTNDNNNNKGEKNISNFNENKYFYKYINTFNLNILIKILTKDNIYNLVNTSDEKNSFLEDISHYSTLFIKEQNNNLDTIINISPDSLLKETNDKLKYSYIISMLNSKLLPYISTLHNKILYNIFKINLSSFNKEKKIYI